MGVIRETTGRNSVTKIYFMNAVGRVNYITAILFGEPASDDAATVVNKGQLESELIDRAAKGPCRPANINDKIITNQVSNLNRIFPNIKLIKRYVKTGFCRRTGLFGIFFQF